MQVTSQWIVVNHYHYTEVSPRFPINLLFRDDLITTRKLGLSLILSSNDIWYVIHCHHILQISISIYDYSNNLNEARLCMT